MSEGPSPQPVEPHEGLSPLERGLRLFTDVRPGEGRTALLMLANVFPSGEKSTDQIQLRVPDNSSGASSPSIFNRRTNWSFAAPASTT